MSLKQVLLVLAGFIAILAAITALSMPQEAPEEPAPPPYSFNLFIRDSGLLDCSNASASRAYVNIDLVSASAEDSGIEFVVLGKPPLSGIYAVSDYPGDKEKMQVMKDLKSNLSQYGLSVQSVTLEKAMDKEGSIIILPSNAMPDSLSSGGLPHLIQSNAVIYFGKSLDFSIDQSGSASLVNDSLYDLLNVTYSGGIISPKYDGPKTFEEGSATTLEYPEGWFVVYGDETTDGLGKEISDLIIHQSWQSNNVGKTYLLPSTVNQSITLFSAKASGERFFPRLIFSSHSENDSAFGFSDLKPLEDLNGTLILPEIAGSSRELPYSFELHNNLTYPVNYDLNLIFRKDGDIEDSVKAKPVTMKTLAVESGAVKPNLTSGSYVVDLVDQSGDILARGYTHVPEIRIRLYKIDGYEHFFNITVDGAPAANKKVFLIVNNESNFTIHTDRKGQASATFGLAPGLYVFSAYVDGEIGNAYYMKSNDDLEMIVYPLLFFGALIGLGVFALRYKTKKRWRIKTFHRPSSVSKTIKIPYDVFLDLFKKTQDSRAKGLPLTVSDMRMGIRKHTVYRGSPVFITDSNIFHVLDSLVKKGKFLSFDGFFLPSSMNKGKPIEYWVLKRKLMDHSISLGGSISSVKGADFFVRGKLLHIWGDIDPKKLVRQCRKSDIIIIFPDTRRKHEFSIKASQYDPQWMRVLLEVRHGRIYCQTLEEFLERGGNGKA